MPLAPEFIAQAATELIARRSTREPGPRLPEACRPADLEDGWQVQLAVSGLLGQRIGGWKASVPSPGKLVVAPIYAPTISRAPVCNVHATHTVNLEPEVAFVMARDLPARPHAYTDAEVDAAVGSVHAALEICASRYLSRDGLPFAEVLADGLVNSGLWLGPELAAPPVPAFALTWQIDGEAATPLEARHPDGNPRAPLYWLANFLRERGMGLQAGQAVITGSYAGVLVAPLHKRLSFDYAGLATFEVMFAG